MNAPVFSETPGLPCAIRPGQALSATHSQEFQRPANLAMVAQRGVSLVPRTNTSSFRDFFQAPWHGVYPSNKTKRAAAFVLQPFEFIGAGDGA